MECSVRSLTSETTSSLSSTLAKILENFVSLKALLNNLNEKSANDLAQNVEVIITDFSKLREKLDCVDAALDEDLARQWDFYCNRENNPFSGWDFLCNDCIKELQNESK